MSPLEMMYHPPVVQDAFKTTLHPVHLPNPVYRKHPSKPTLQLHLPILSITIRDLLMLDHPTHKDSVQTMAPMWGGKRAWWNQSEKGLIQGIVFGTTESTLQKTIWMSRLVVRTSTLL
jgi:hypothetical protein